MNTSLQCAIAAFLLFIGVATGAFGAHALNGLVDMGLMAVWHTAVLYLLVHGLGLFVLAVATPYLVVRLQNLAYTLLLIGTLLFTGSLFLLVLSSQSWLGMITPIGGILMLGGWAVVAVAALQKLRQS